MDDRTELRMSLFGLDGTLNLEQRRFYQTAMARYLENFYNDYIGGGQRASVAEVTADVKIIGQEYKGEGGEEDRPLRLFRTRVIPRTKMKLAEFGLHQVDGKASEKGAEGLDYNDGSDTEAYLPEFATDESDGAARWDDGSSSIFSAVHDANREKGYHPGFIVNVTSKPEEAEHGDGERPGPALCERLLLEAP